MNPICLSLSGLLDYPRMQNTVLASKCLQYKINNWQRVAGCRVIIGCRRRLKQSSSSTADSLVISFGLNENHGLNPSKEIRKMWAHYWCPLTGWFVCIRLSFFYSQVEPNLLIHLCHSGINAPLLGMSAASFVNALKRCYFSFLLYAAVGSEKTKSGCTCRNNEEAKCLHNSLYGLKQIL